MKLNSKYDAVIIGAGIGGLVCGCYLAKAGMKVLIIEQASKPGGYCTSFKREKYKFDSAAHALGGCREGGPIGKVIRELALDKLVFITRSDPSEVVYTPIHKISFRNQMDQTIDGFCRVFPSEKQNIERFFNLVANANIARLYIMFKNKSFDDVINHFFINDELKSVLGILMGHLVIAPSDSSALAAIIFLREFIFDGGYYPTGGMQTFSDALVDRFIGYGGNIKLSSRVSKINIHNNKICGVIVEKSNYINSEVVISNCDAYQVFFELIGRDYLNSTFIKKFNNLRTSISCFLLYIGFDADISEFVDDYCATWFIATYDINKIYKKMIKKGISLDDDYLFITFPSSHYPKVYKEIAHTAVVLAGATYKRLAYWKKNKDIITQALLRKVNHFMPSLGKHIVFKESATPYTLYRYTLNRNGAMRGWQADVRHLNELMITGKTQFDNLFLTGHWTTLATGSGGIPMVAYSGRQVAELVLNYLNKFKQSILT